jgi:transposase
MLNAAIIESVYLARGSTDMRKSIDGLAILVQMEFNLDPFSSSLFVFCNKQRNKLKILHWDTNGFWLYYRRLERGKFHWPSGYSGSGPYKISRRQLNWLLDGLALEQKKAHPIVSAKTVI